jgi:hypothetical protein
MSKSRVYFEKEVSLSGSASGFQAVEIAELALRSGRIIEVLVREDAAGLATAVDLYIVQTNTAPTTTPDDLDCAYKNTTVALTASATAASLDDVVEAGGSFRRAVSKFVVGNFTASGAFVVNVLVKVEFDA